MIRIQQLKLPVKSKEKDLYAAVASKLKIPVSAITGLVIKKRSIDARKKPDIYYVYTVDVETANEAKIVKKAKNPSIAIAADIRYQMPQSGEEQMKGRPVIIGCGPAGLFCGLLLARAGYRPIILERGECVEDRTRTIDRFWAGDRLNTKSNVQFGEGGAGTFSDGKLNTMVKDAKGRNHFVLQTFVEAGANPEILYVNKPHVGTDVLKVVIRNIREEIIRQGGEVHFQTKMTDFIRQADGSITILTDQQDSYHTDSVVLAIGHSARDTFAVLKEKKLFMQPKSFAVGVRVEHPQSIINEHQYGTAEIGDLPVADYKVTHKLPDGRGVYSFCMCPGGYVVNASSEENMLAVNGMSYSKRDSKNANSAIIVTVTPEDYQSNDVLSGVEFQRKLERAAYNAGNGKIPAQLFGDFKQNVASSVLGDVEPCTKGAYELTNLREIFPKFISHSIAEGIDAFERQIKGYSRKDAVLLGVESRTSSPVKILRNEEFVSSIPGIYPCGEGAGYAGGITSAAMDGMKVAEAIIQKYKRPTA